MVVSGPLGVGLNLVAAARLPRGPARANRHPPPLIPRNSVRINSIAANNAAVDTRSSGPAFPTAGWPLSPCHIVDMRRVATLQPRYDSDP
jgi:hypothetical protein